MDINEVYTFLTGEKISFKHNTFFSEHLPDVHALGEYQNVESK